MSFSSQKRFFYDYIILQKKTRKVIIPDREWSGNFSGIFLFKEMTENRAKEGATEMKRLKKNTGWSKWISLTLIVLLAAAILAGCGSADQGAESGAEDGVTAYVGGTIFESSLDPVKGGMAYGYSFINSALTKVSPESEYVGDLAKDWEISDDARTYTFKLRQDVKFHDGSDFTAEDVVFTYNTVKENQGDNANVDLSRLESVTARGDDTVVFTLKEPYSSFWIRRRC